MAAVYRVYAIYIVKNEQFMYVHNPITTLSEDYAVYNKLVNSVVMLPKVNTFLKG